MDAGSPSIAAVKTMLPTKNYTWEDPTSSKFSWKHIFERSLRVSDVGGQKKKSQLYLANPDQFEKLPTYTVLIQFLARCAEKPEKSWYFRKCPDGQPTQ